MGGLNPRRGASRFSPRGSKFARTPVRRSNQLIYMYEATDHWTWSFVGSNVPVMNESMNEMNHCVKYENTQPAIIILSITPS